jgi:hypothetical protein
MLVKRRLSLIFLFVFTIALSVTTGLAFAGTLIEDFDDGDAEGWERSPQNGDNDNVIWEVVDEAMMFDPQGEDWTLAISQMNFVGIPGVENVSEWTDYEFEVDIKHEEMANYPGGIRVRVDLDTGGHYALWLYPGNGNMKLYKNPGWDINTGLSTLGEAAYKPDVDEFHTLKIACEGDTITVFYDGDEMISAEDNEHKEGTIALGVQDRVVYYDNIKVTGAQIPNLKLSPVEPAGKLSATWGEIKSGIAL